MDWDGSDISPLEFFFLWPKRNHQEIHQDTNEVSFCILRRSDKLPNHESILDESDLDERLPSIYYACWIVGTNEECSPVCLVPILGDRFEKKKSSPN